MRERIPHKVHIRTRPYMRPNDSVPACGEPVAEFLTEFWEWVTCKRCLRTIPGRVAVPRYRRPAGAATPEAARIPLPYEPRFGLRVVGPMTS